MSDTAQAVAPPAERVNVGTPEDPNATVSGESTSAGPLLTRDQILDADDLALERVPVPEWGGDVMVRPLTANERDKYEAGFLDPKALRKGQTFVSRMEDVRARLVSLTIVDEAGARMFGDADVKRLGAKNAAAMDRVVKAARDASGMTREDLEELAEGFEDDPRED